MSDRHQTKSGDPCLAGGLTRRDFVHFSFGTITFACFGLALAGCHGKNKGNSGWSALGKVNIPHVPTTLEATIKPTSAFSTTIPAQDLKNVFKYDEYGYGRWTDGGPLTCERRSDIMPAMYAGPQGNGQITLLRFFAISDIHITDKESPAQLIYLQQLNPSGNARVAVEAQCTSVYSPTMLYTTHVLDAVVQTVNALHQENPIDFGISLGDACNSAQYNELRWYIDVLDGGVVIPSSGAHVGGDTVDYQRPYQAAGLNPLIPWYQVIGNHDHFWIGSIPIQPGGSLANSYTGDEIPATGNALRNGNDIYNSSPPQYYMGVIDGSTPYGETIKAGKCGDPGFTSPPKVVPDQSRRPLTMAAWKREFFNTSTSPIGHGFNLVPPGQEEGFACYSFVPKSDIPIKVIVLDDTQREDDGSTSIHGHGFLDPARWNWLKNELADGDAAGQFMIIAAHVPICVQPMNTFMEWYDNSANPSQMQNAVSLAELLAELYRHPNLLMWIAGHRHVNAVKAFVSPDPVNAPERGFWQIETSSLHDFPQQMRLFEINLNNDCTISIVATNIDPLVSEGTPSWTSRKYAVAAQQIVNTRAIYQYSDTNFLVDPITQNRIVVNGAPLTDPSIRSMPSGSYNAELFVPLSSAMKKKMQELFPNVVSAFG